MYLPWGVLEAGDTFFFMFHFHKDVFRSIFGIFHKKRGNVPYMLFSYDFFADFEQKSDDFLLIFLSIS